MLFSLSMVSRKSFEVNASSICASFPNDVCYYPKIIFCFAFLISLCWSGMSFAYIFSYFQFNLVLI